MDKKNDILTKLNEIEKYEGVRILYATESGSRAWGFESKDSDYDVRFIYARPFDWYLSIEGKKDVIEYPVTDLLDISGWDIKKALNLFKKSNPPLYEWLNSPIVYIKNESFVTMLRKLIPKFYNPRASLYHYLHMAKGNYREYLKGDKVRVKKYFYVLRPTFACMWIEKNKTPPPMEFNILLSSFVLEKTLKSEIEKLLVRKKSGEEFLLELKKSEQFAFSTSIQRVRQT